MSEIMKCERCKEYNAAAVDFRHQATSAQNDYAALLARHNALRDAVAWERECIRQLDYVGRFWDDDNVPGRELIMILDAARAEVDRLLLGESCPAKT